METSTNTQKIKIKLALDFKDLNMLREEEKNH